MSWLSWLVGDGFMPHGHCFLWRGDLLALHVISDSLIGAAYLAISTALLVLVRRARELPFQRTVTAFGVFIVACGFTHLIAVWTMWTPAYWISGVAKAVTAVASIATAAAMPALVPRVLATLSEAHLARAHRRRVQTAHVQLRSLAERLQRESATRSRFFANISHDLKTPLALILGAVSDTREEGLDPASAAAVERGALLLDRQLDDLLQLARQEEEGAGPAYRRMDLTALARECAVHFEPVADRRDIELSVESDGVTWLDADPALIERVLLNLFFNAFRFTPRGGHVTVRVSAQRDNESATLEVIDTGPGVPHADRSLNFRRHRQSEVTRPEWKSGTGLGLAVANELVTAHGGAISVEDGDGGIGSCFRVTLPRVAPEGLPLVLRERDPELGERVARTVAAELTDRGQTDAVPADAEHTERSPRVLLVEDDDELRCFLADVLSTEFRVEAACDVASALACIEATPPAAVLTDVMLRGESGEHLVDALTCRGSAPPVSAWAPTTRPSSTSRARGCRARAQSSRTSSRRCSSARGSKRVASSWSRATRTSASCSPTSRPRSRSARRRRGWISCSLSRAPARSPCGPTRAFCSSWSRTSSATRSSTRRRGSSRSARARGTVGSSSTSPTPGAGSPRPCVPTCSSRSSGATTRAAPTSRARDSASPSCATSDRPSTRRCCSRTRAPAGRPSGSW